MAGFGVFHYDSKLGKVVDGPAPKSGKIATYNYFSEAMAVNPNQAGELRQFYASHGMDVEVNADGAPRVTCRSQAKKIAQLRGFYQRNGGYSDP